MGTPEKPQRTTRLDGVHQLLPKVHKRILKHRKSPQRTYEEGGPMGLDRRERRSLPEIEKAYLYRTGTPHAKARGTLRTGSRRVKLRDRGNNKPKGRTGTVASGGLLLYHSLRNRTKLQHIRQRTVSSRKIPSPLENIPSRSPTPNSHPHRPLKPPVLERTPKNQSTHRARVPRAARVQLRT